MSELVEIIVVDATEKMDKAVAHARSEFSTVRTGRASSSFVEKLVVDYYGSEVPMQQLASFSVPEARLLVISPFDKESVGAIEKAIQEADLGLNPSTDGVVIRLSFPMLTEERRKELVRLVKQMAEDTRQTIRGVRRTARQDLDVLDRDGDASADEVKRGENDLDKTTQVHEGKVDEALALKEDELLEV